MLSSKGRDLLVTVSPVPGREPGTDRTKKAVQ